MKKYLVLFFFSLLFFACKKEPDDNNNTGPAPNPVGDPPSVFSKKIFLEVFKGEWNPNCPTGDDTLKAMMALDSNVLSACIHQGDWLAITPFFNELNLHLGGVNGYPRAAIDRVPATLGSQIDSTVISIFNWRANVEQLLLTQTADQGLAIYSTEKNNDLDITVCIGYHDSVNKSTRLSVYLIEDSIMAQNQVNAPPSYIHHNVLRKVLTQNLGDSIAMLDGKMITRSFSVDIAGLYAQKSNLRIIAFVHVIGADAKTNEVLNVQQARISEVKKWD